MKPFIDELKQHRTMMNNLANCHEVIDIETIVLTDSSEHATLTVCVPSAVTARIQEAHILIGHYWGGVVEEKLSVSDNT